MAVDAAMPTAPSPEAIALQAALVTPSNARSITCDWRGDRPHLLGELMLLLMPEEGESRSWLSLAECALRVLVKSLGVLAAEAALVLMPAAAALVAHTSSVEKGLLAGWGVAACSSAGAGSCTMLRAPLAGTMTMWWAASSCMWGVAGGKGRRLSNMHHFT